SQDKRADDNRAYNRPRDGAVAGRPHHRPETRRSGARVRRRSDQQGPPPGSGVTEIFGMASGEGVTVPETSGRRPHRLATILRSQMRNIAPFLTLIFLSAFFAIASPSFATIDNVGNILPQVSVTGIIAVGLTFVILCAEIDLSIASIANVTGIAVAYFTMQEAYVNIANVPLPGWAAILLALVLCALLGFVNAFGLTVIGIPSFIMTLAMMQIAAGISAL